MVSNALLICGLPHGGIFSTNGYGIVVVVVVLSQMNNFAGRAGLGPKARPAQGTNIYIYMHRPKTTTFVSF